MKTDLRHQTSSAPAGSTIKKVLWLHLGILMALPYLGLLGLIFYYDDPLATIPLPGMLVGILFILGFVPVLGYISLIMENGHRVDNPIVAFGALLASLVQVAVSSALAGGGVFLFAYQAAVVELFGLGLVMLLAVVLRMGDAWREAGIVIPLGAALIAAPALLYSWPLLVDALTWSLPSQILMVTAILTSVKAYAFSAHGLPVLSRRRTSVAEDDDVEEADEEQVVLEIGDRAQMGILYVGLVTWFLIPCIAYVADPPTRDLESFKSVSAENLERWEVDESPDDVLLLDGVTLVRPSEAEALASYGGREIWLRDVESLDEETASALASWEGRVLILHGLRELDDATAAALAQWDGEVLALTGLPKVSSRTAAALSRWEGQWLAVDAPAEEFDDFQGCLAKEDAVVRKVEQIRSSTPPTLADLQAHAHTPSPEGVLILPELTGLTGGDAEALATYEGRNIQLNRLHDLCPSAAEALGQWRGDALQMNGLSRLSSPAASALAHWQGNTLELRGLRSLSESVASALAQWEGAWLAIGGLSRDDAEAASALARWDGQSLTLTGLEGLTQAAIYSLVHWSGDQLNLHELESLNEDTAAALATWEGNHLSIRGVHSLDAAAATELARWMGEGRLGLPSLESIDRDAAAALATWSGATLSTGRLDESTPEAIAALEQFEGRLSRARTIDELLQELDSD